MNEITERYIDFLRAHREARGEKYPDAYESFKAGWEAAVVTLRERRRATVENQIERFLNERKDHRQRPAQLDPSNGDDAAGSETVLGLRREQDPT